MKFMQIINKKHEIKTKTSFIKQIKKKKFMASEITELYFISDKTTTTTTQKKLCPIFDVPLQLCAAAKQSKEEEEKKKMKVLLFKLIPYLLCNQRGSYFEAL